jgi:hypothetical protein
MALAAVVNAVSARLGATWSGLKVQGPNTIEDAPDDGSPFLALQFLVANTEQISFGAPGSNIWREEGVFRIVVNAARDQAGAAQALAWADDIAALFRGKQFGGVVTFAPSAGPLDDRNDNGNFFQLSVAVPYQFDLIG